jgi:hypothetical protein
LLDILTTTMATKGQAGGRERLEVIADARRLRNAGVDRFRFLG